MEKAIAVIFGLAFGAALCFLFTYPLMWIINYLFTKETLTLLFGVSQLYFWRTFWLSWLCSWLFKSTVYSGAK